MEALTRKRARLRHELQWAYSAWLESTEIGEEARPIPAPVDISGCCDAVRAKWFTYRAAKNRLILAYAEQP